MTSCSFPLNTRRSTEPGAGRRSLPTEAIRPVMVGMDYFKQMTGSTGTAWGQIMAYASMITVPVLALFIAFQRAFINSIASSGVKG